MTHDPRGESSGLPALELVVAVSENDVIGRGNRLPWHLSDDLRRFKSLTLGKGVLMGRRTFESIGKALPGRTNVILTRSADFAPASCVVADSLAAARRAVPGGTPLMVIGGADVYRQCLPAVERIHLTLVHTDISDGDTFFDGWRGPQWRELERERHDADARNDFPYSFITLERI